MKICRKCGAYNSDERYNCIDCGEKLGKKLSEREEKEVLGGVNDKIENMYNRADPLYVSTFDKVMGVVAILGFLCSIVLLIGGNISYPNDGLLWASVIIFPAAVVEAFIPKVAWTIERLRLGFLIDDAEDAQPSVFYTIGRKACILFTVIVGLLILAKVFFGG